LLLPLAISWWLVGSSHPLWFGSFGFSPLVVFLVRRFSSAMSVSLQLFRRRSLETPLGVGLLPEPSATGCVLFSRFVRLRLQLLWLALVVSMLLWFSAGPSCVSGSVSRLCRCRFGFVWIRLQRC
jgi:hypothetical protein